MRRTIDYSQEIRQRQHNVTKKFETYVIAN
jgi:hypothetical protein